MDWEDASTDSDGSAVSMPVISAANANAPSPTPAAVPLKTRTSTKLSSSNDQKSRTSTKLSNSNEKTRSHTSRHTISKSKTAEPQAVEELEDPDLVTKDEMQGALVYFVKNKRNSKLSRTCWCWLVWFGVFTAVVFMARDVTKGYELESAMKDILMDEEFEPQDSHIKKTFRDIGDTNEFWQWLEGPLLNGVGQQDREEEAFVLGHNRLLGSVRLRQLRVEANSCEITSALQPFMKGCFAEYRAGTKSTSPFGPGTTGFTYEETNSPVQVGEAFTQYDSGGFVVDLSYNAIVAAQQLASLRADGWIDRQTKAILTTVNIFNPNVNNFLSMIFMVETTRGGGLIPTVIFRSFRADLYLTGTDTLRLVLEIWLALMLVGMDIAMIRSMLRVIRKKANIVTWLLTPWWNFVHLLNLCVTTAGAIVYIQFLVNLSDFRSNIKSLNQDRDFTRMEELGYQWTIAFNLFAGSLFLSIFYFFKFLNVSFRMALLWRTLQRAGADLASFLIFFFIIFLAYVVTGYMIFGTELYAWRSFGASFFTSFNILLGEFNYDELAEEGHRYLAPVWFVSFVVLITFILMNMFLAILNAAWDELQRELDEHDTLGDALRKALITRYQWIVQHLRDTKNLKAPKLDKSLGRDLFNQLAVDDDEDEDDDGGAAKLAQYDDVPRLLGEWCQRSKLDESSVPAMRELVNKYRRSRDTKQQRAAERAKVNNDVTYSDFLLVVMQLQRLETAMGLTPTPIDPDRAKSAAGGLGTAGLALRGVPYSPTPAARMSTVPDDSHSLRTIPSDTNLYDDTTDSTTSSTE